jgi:hypothetical protein
MTGCAGAEAAGAFKPTTGTRSWNVAAAAVDAWSEPATKIAAMTRGMMPLLQIVLGFIL